MTCTTALCFSFRQRHFLCDCRLRDKRAWLSSSHDRREQRCGDGEGRGNSATRARP